MPSQTTEPPAQSSIPNGESSNFPVFPQTARTAMSEFSHSECGMTRFPPNVEQIHVEHASTTTWLVVRRNDAEFRFPLSEGDRRSLYHQLLGGLSADAK